MTEDFQQALLQVAKSMDGLAQVFEHRVAELRALGESEEQIRDAVGAVQAVKDSGAIYLTWANHYAKRVAGGEMEAENDLADDDFES
ncbi:MAG: hypothetical protein ACOYXR_05130 [Nitrospirota bacterium]